MYVDVSDKEVADFVSCITKIVCSIGLNKSEQISLAKEYVRCILFQSFNDYNISGIEIIDMLMRSIYRSGIEFPKASKSLILAEFGNVCVGNNVLNVKKFIDFVFNDSILFSLEDDGVDRTYLDLGQVVNVDRFNKQVIDNRSVDEFRIVLHALFDSYHVDKEEWHRILEMWLTDHCYQYLSKGLITDTEFQKIISMAERCDEFIKKDIRECFDLKYIEFLNGLIKNKNGIFTLDSVVTCVDCVVQERVKDPIPYNTKVIVDSIGTEECVRASVVGYHRSEYGEFNYIVKPEMSVGDYECYLVSKGALRIVR